MDYNLFSKIHKMATPRKRSFGNSLKGIKHLFSSRMPIPDRSNGDQYHYIHNFAQSTDKECLRYDKENEKIYRDHIRAFNEFNSMLAKQNLPMRIEDKPISPKRPNNYERLCEWRRQNVKKSVQDQSVALLYLIANNVSIKFPSSKCEGIQPYEALVEAEKLSLLDDKTMEVVVVEFLDKLSLNTSRKNSLDKLFLEQYGNKSNSMRNTWIDVDTQSNKNYIGLNYDDISKFDTNDNRLDNRQSHSNKERNTSTTTNTTNTTTPNLINVTNFHLPKLEQDDNNMKCEKPEHHQIPEKIQFFENSSKFTPKNQYDLTQPPRMVLSHSYPVLPQQEYPYPPDDNTHQQPSAPPSYSENNRNNGFMKKQ